jgi:hypothetical protein
VALGGLVVVAQVDPVVLDVEARLPVVVELVVRAEGEERESVCVADFVRDTKLIVPVPERVVGHDERDERPGVRVATRRHHRALVIVERRLDEGVRVVEARREVAVQAIGLGRRGLAGDDGARVPAVARGIGAREQVDRVDERR